MPHARLALQRRDPALDGIVFVAFTNWLSPWGGHETSPWHYLGGERAARRYQRRHGEPPKNRYGRSLYPVSVADAQLVFDIVGQPFQLPAAVRAAAALPPLTFVLDHLGNVVGDVFVRRCERKDGQLVNTIIETYPGVSQFWTYDEKAFLANPVYTRDYPPAKNLEN